MVTSVICVVSLLSFFFWCVGWEGGETYVQAVPKTTAPRLGGSGSTMLPVVPT